MPRFLLAAVAAAGLCAAPAMGQTPPTQTPPPPPASVDGYRAPVGETFLVERAEISPDGTKVAYVVALGNTRRLRVQSLDGSLVRMANLLGADLRDLVWAGNDHILLTVRRESFDAVDPADGGVFSVLSYNVQRDGYETLLFNRSEMRSNTVRDATRMAQQPRMFPIVLDRAAIRTENGRPSVYVSTLSLDGSCRNDLYRVEPDTGGARLSSQGGGQAVAFVVDDKGKLLARQDRDGSIKMGRGAAWRPATAREIQGGTLVGPGLASRSILVRVGQGRDGRLYEVTGDRGEHAQVADVEGLISPSPIYDDQTGRLLGYSGADAADGLPSSRFIDPNLRRIWGSVAAAFQGSRVQLASWSADFNQLVVFVSTAEGAEYQLVDVAKGESRLLAPSYLDSGVAPVGPGSRHTVAALDRTGSDIGPSIRAEAQAGIIDPRTVCRIAQGRNLTMP